MDNKSTVRLILFAVLTTAIFLSAASAVLAAPKADLWPRWQKHDPASTKKIDHSAWERFLKKYLVAPHPSGINRVRYNAVGPDDRTAVNAYLKNLQGLPISSYNRAEQ